MAYNRQEAHDRPLKRENPHKYLLYKPTLSQLLVFLASGFKELPINGALLLYISADGLFPSSSSAEDRKDSAKIIQKRSIILLLTYLSTGYDMGGVCMNNKREPDPNFTKRGHSQIKDMHWYFNI